MSKTNYQRMMDGEPFTIDPELAELRATAAMRLAAFHAVPAGGFEAMRAATA